MIVKIKIAKQLNQGKSFWAFLFMLFTILLSAVNNALATNIESNHQYKQKEQKISKTFQQESSPNTLFTLDDIKFEEDTEVDSHEKLNPFIYSTLTVSKINRTNEKYYLAAFKQRKQKIRIYIINQVFRN